ncbi:MAG: DUF1328 domain-containing protein [Bdellovibrionales bacterium RIFOXYD12_FULL_39_22]|nr:MAG: DUF1328 domain-containing protein [Bdellovibrionales bacterium RIFOXYB1_FULL_39_21]OFZ43718.1 MAG: DUF1328 domain-containing protein [Bdellovibrionales bacterium RIFOXYC12_FULL_39_17]OFZ48111.1 MAG: DUF1328 domain-containing protein [Bdellovibrionales bacterium RIFOXYC1_FULL_39_130]OFZ74590.1 MAG: DUF1328 domain-containing protein [Bdellovibrionales bacterium RIFOXYC2_FULL_39_8]OFZ77226.1 MAG: DUF1328 domain-containing protein [Bdellovibrionales bacterium RIFOXYD1_FULL_39_84]OFZ95714.1
MLYASVTFFLIGLFAYILGAYNIAGLSLDIGKIAFFIFIALSILSFFINLITGKKSKTDITNLY